MFQNGIIKRGFPLLSGLMGFILFVIMIIAAISSWMSKSSIPTWSKSLTNPVASAAFSPDAAMLAVGDDKGNVTIVDNPSKDPSKTIVLSSNPPIRISALRFSSDSKTLFGGGSDGVIRIWNVHSHQLEAKLSGHGDAILSLDLSKDDQFLFSEATGDPIHCWSIKGKKIINTVKTSEPSVGTPRLSLSPADNIFATATFSESAPTIWTYGAKGISKVSALLRTSEHGAFYCIAFSPDGKKLATGTWDSEVIIWDVANRKQVSSFRLDSYPVVSVAFSPDNSLVAAIEGAKTMLSSPKLKIWSLLTGSECVSVRGSSSGFSVVTFSPDGQGLVTGSHDGFVHYWVLNELIH